MIRIQFPRSKLARGLTLIFALWVVNSVVVAWISSPLEAVREHADELAGDAGPLSLREGGYRVGLLGMRAYGRYIVGEGDERRELVVEISRWTPFTPWRLDAMSQEAVDRTDDRSERSD